MLRKEWSLIVNSLIIQLAAGLFTFLAVYRLLLTDQAGRETAIRLTAPGMTLAGPIILTGMIVSLFHLGQPLRAYRAAIHVGTSWLSREVFFTGAFFALWAASVWMGESGTSNTILVWLTVTVGLLCVLSMSGIYRATGKPGWSGFHTYISFFGTLIIFGSVSSSMIMISNGQGIEIVQAMSVAFILAALLMLAVRLVYQIKLFSALKTDEQVWSLDNLVNATHLPLPARLASLNQSLTLWGWGLSFFGMALTLYALTTGKAHPRILILTAIAVLVLTGESLQRIAFNSLGFSEETAK